MTVANYDDNHSFYTSRKWRKKREQILRRDKFLCRVCSRYGKNVEAKIVHHIQELSDRPDLCLRDDNLISLCAKCHNQYHKGS